MIKKTTGFIDGLAENAHLPRLSWDDDSRAPRATIVICHGMMEHAERYEELALTLVKAGYAVIAYTQRGHKGAVASKADYGVLSEHGDGFALLVEDLETIIRRTEEAHPSCPVMLLGHSMGSFVAQAVAGRNQVPLAALVLSGSNRQGSLEARLGHALAKGIVRRHGRRAPGGVVERLAIGNNNRAFAPARTSVDWLARNTEDVDRYLADEWCGGHFPAGFYEDFMAFLVRLNTIRKGTSPQLPILLLGGGHDPVGKNGKGLRTLAKDYRQTGVADLTLKIYPEDRHEVLFETDRETVIKDLIAFLDAHIPSDPLQNA